MTALRQMKPQVLVSIPIYAPVLAQLEQEFTVHKLWEAVDPEKFLKDISGDVRAVITTGLRGFRPGYIDELPRLELVACFGTPHGTIDLEATAKRGIAVTNTPDTIADAVGELAAGMAVALMRRICENDRFVRSGQWPQRAPDAGNTLVGKRCGIVGLGRIGRETATRVEASACRLRIRAREGRTTSHIPTSRTSSRWPGNRTVSSLRALRLPRRKASSTPAFWKLLVRKAFS